MGHNLIEKFWYFKQFSANFHKKMIYSQKIIVALQPILAIPIYWWKSDDNTKYCLTNKWKRFAAFYNLFVSPVKSKLQGTAHRKPSCAFYETQNA